MLMLGHLPPERLFPALAAADVVALPSLWEPFSLAALEAMALARPLVASSGVFPPYVRDGENALLVAPEDPRALGEALVALLGDGDLRERLGATAAAAADDHDVTPNARRFVEALRSVLGGAP